MRPEAALQRQIKAHLNAKGLWAVHVPNGAVLGGNKRQRAIQVNSLKADGMQVGFPDLLVYGGGRRLGHLEVKCEGQKQSENQIKVQARIEAMGHKYAVVRSIADVDETLSEWGWQ